MADLLDQYDTSTHLNTNPFLDDIEPVSSGFVTVPSDKDKGPMFVKEKVNVGSNVGRKIVDVAVANNVMIVVYGGCRVKRLDLANVAEFDVVEFSKNKEDEIEHAFLDPSGSHLIVSLVSGESMYLGRNNKKPRVLAKLKNHKIRCVGWNQADKEVSRSTRTTHTCTGQILFGTEAGLVLESEIDSEEKFLSMGSEKPAKIIFNVNEQSEKQEPVCKIFMEKAGRKHPNRFVIFVVTYSRFYQFVGDIGMELPVFQPVFDVFKPTPAPYVELPSLGYTDFSIFSPRKSTSKNLVKHFAWLTGLGVYFGDLVDLVDTEVGAPNITTNTRILPSTETATESPVSMHVTEFHCLLLFMDKMKAICSVNNAEVHEEHMNTVHEGTMLGLRYDAGKRTLWAFSDSQVYRYNIMNESRDVWKLYLDRKDFQRAKEYCKQNVVHMDEVWRREAEYLYKEEKYMQSAQCYALSQVPFEEVALKFLQVKDTEALKIYLQKKLFDLKGNDNTQLTMLVTWIIELYLSQLGDLRDKGAKEEKKYKQLEDDFQHFLNQSRVHVCLEQNKHVAYDLLSSHADTDNYIFFAMLMKDYPRVIRHHIQQDDFLAALNVLSSSSEGRKKRIDYHGLFEQFSPTLMQHVPGELVKLWKNRDLDPKKLIPALVTQSEKNDNNIRFVIDYLEHCVDNLGVNEEAIHNYLISLYCKVDDEPALIKYLSRYAQDDRNVFFDKKYALRLCSENHKHEAAVKIYCAMELYEEAVDLALKEVDIETAKLCAEKPEFDDALRRKLWCKVARHVVEREEDIAKAMELLEECQAINKQTNRQCKLLKIEDILRFFPDFATIDHFKDAICESLQDYNQHIERLKQAMQEATDSAATVRGEINDIRNRYGTVAAGDKCDMCGYPLVTRSFYYFPCSHVFHSDCLIAEILLHLKDKQRTKLEEHISMLTALSGPVVGSGGSAAGGRTREQVQESVDDIVAEECVLCGDIMIRSLDKPFIDEDKFDEVMDSWR